MGVNKDGQHDGLPWSIEFFQEVDSHLGRVKAEVDGWRTLHDSPTPPSATRLNIAADRAFGRIQTEIDGCREALHQFRDELGEQDKDEYLEGKEKRLCD